MSCYVMSYHFASYHVMLCSSTLLYIIVWYAAVHCHEELSAEAGSRSLARRQVGKPWGHVRNNENANMYRILTHIHIYIYIRICMFFIYKCSLCVRIYSYIYTYIYMHIHTYIHTYIKTYIHTYIHIYIWYMYINTVCMCAHSILKWYHMLWQSLFFAKPLWW